MQLKGVIAGAVVACGLAAAGAHAGAKFSQQVGVDYSNQRAWGDVAGARASADTNQYIGCSLYVEPGPVGNKLVYCDANDSTGAYAGCISTDPSLIQAATAFSNFSYVEFGWTPFGGCTYMRVSNYSFQPPMVP